MDNNNIFPFKSLANRNTNEPITKDKIECPKPNTKSYTPKPELDIKIVLAKITPAIIPYPYFLSKTNKWFNISEIRNWIFPKDIKANTVVITTYNAATIALTINTFTLFCFISFPPSFLNRGMVANLERSKRHERLYYKPLGNTRIILSEPLKEKKFKQNSSSCQLTTQ